MSSQNPAHKHRVGHHFDNFEQELSANTFGFWLFMATEILMFGGLFVAFTVFQHWHPDVFHEAHRNLDRTLGATNTLVLIASSFSMAMAVRAVQTNKRGQAIALLCFTLACAATFMVIKFFEYQAKFEHGLLPGAFYVPHGPDSPAQGNLFFGLYFMMTGLHGIHVLAGMGVIVWILIWTIQGRFSSNWYTPVELVGIYWHLVDLVWIYLFPLFYLIG